MMRLHSIRIAVGIRYCIEEMRLPYTEVHVIYDDNLCLPQHWALAKIKTYSMQTVPFLHVDGDVYISRPFDESLEHAPLVVQNEENGSEYYRMMLDRIMNIPHVWFPDFVKGVIKEDPVPSYNMGVFGGCDLDFIHMYCRKAEQFLAKNEMNNFENPYSCVDCNVFFEQMLFATLAVSMGKCVCRVVPFVVRDNGYTRRDFCDLAYFSEKKYFHLLGGHKRVEQVCRLMAYVLLSNYPEYFAKIVKISAGLSCAFVFRWSSSYGSFLERKKRGMEGYG